MLGHFNILFFGELQVKQGNVGDKHNTKILVTSFKGRSPILLVIQISTTIYNMLKSVLVQVKKTNNGYSAPKCVFVVITNMGARWKSKNTHKNGNFKPICYIIEFKKRGMICHEKPELQVKHVTLLQCTKFNAHIQSYLIHTLKPNSMLIYSHIWYIHFNHFQTPLFQFDIVGLIWFYHCNVLVWDYF